MGNEEFRIEDWLWRFPLAHRGADQTGMLPLYKAQQITSPEDICLNEQLRQAVREIIEWGPAVPVDVFIMTVGEPSRRHVTKIGGLPYRPAAKPWPRNPADQPMTFLAQFCFTDSKDITGALPGDVLLCFSPTEDPPENMAFEWYPLGLTDLLQPADVPLQPWTFQPCFGHVFRTQAYPEAKEKPGYELSDDVAWQGLRVRRGWLLLQYQATQIGTAPWFIQFDYDKDAIKGRVLCVLNSVQPSLNEPYPWINHPAPLYRKGEASYTHGNDLMFGDAGCVYISLDMEGQLHSHMSCY
jgi:hypothetical protein